MVATRNLVFAMEHIDAVLSSKLKCFLWKNALFREVIRDLRFPIITVKRKQSIDGFHQWQLSEGMEYFLIQASILYQSFQHPNHPSRIQSSSLLIHHDLVPNSPLPAVGLEMKRKCFTTFLRKPNIQIILKSSLPSEDRLFSIFGKVMQKCSQTFTFSFLLTNNSFGKTKMGVAKIRKRKVHFNCTSTT